MVETKTQTLAELRREVLEEAAKLCDRIAVQNGPDNRKASNPRAAYQAGACKCAWELRQLARKTGR